MATMAGTDSVKPVEVVYNPRMGEELEEAVRSLGVADAMERQVPMALRSSTKTYDPTNSSLVIVDEYIIWATPVRCLCSHRRTQTSRRFPLSSELCHSPICAMASDILIVEFHPIERAANTKPLFLYMCRGPSGAVTKPTNSEMSQGIENMIGGVLFPPPMDRGALFPFTGDEHLNARRPVFDAQGYHTEFGGFNAHVVPHPADKAGFPVCSISEVEAWAHMYSGKRSQFDLSSYRYLFLSSSLSYLV